MRSPHPSLILGCLSLCRAFRSCCFSGCAAACALLPAYGTYLHAAKRNKFVVVGLRGASVRKNMRLDSPVLKTLRRGTVSSSTLLNVAVLFCIIYYKSCVGRLVFVVVSHKRVWSDACTGQDSRQTSRYVLYVGMQFRPEVPRLLLLCRAARCVSSGAYAGPQILRCSPNHTILFRFSKKKNVFHSSNLCIRSAVHLICQCRERGRQNFRLR